MIFHYGHYSVCGLFRFIHFSLKCLLMPASQSQNCKITVQRSCRACRSHMKRHDEKLATKDVTEFTPRPSSWKFAPRTSSSRLKQPEAPTEFHVTHATIDNKPAKGPTPSPSPSPALTIVDSNARLALRAANCRCTYSLVPNVFATVTNMRSVSTPVST